MAGNGSVMCMHQRAKHMHKAGNNSVWLREVKSGAVIKCDAQV